MSNKVVTIDYTNHRGERATRQIIPRHMWWGNSKYHTEAQWLLDAFDVGKQAERTFAMKDIHSWSVA